MSLRNYKPKWAKAPWTTAFPAQIRAIQYRDQKAGERLGKPRRVRSVSRRRQAVTAEYRARAAAFVAAAVARGETCPVVAAVPELRNGRRYGWPISNKLTENHHTRGRAGSLLLDERFWMAISKAGHRWVHAHVAEARARGWVCAAGLWNTPL